MTGDKMNSEDFKDWLFRYQYVYRTRRSERSKKRFITALVSDIAKFRQDIQVVEYNANKKSASRNIYVGDLTKADKIICTYYDTPPQSFGGYTFFNFQEQGKKTLQFIIVTAGLMIALGIIGTLTYMNLVDSPFNIYSPITLLAIAIFGIYFYFLGKVTQGLSNRKNLVRNTSSVLAMLKMSQELADSKIAYAFIDEGSYGDKGLVVLRQSVGKGKIFVLDCIGATAPLHFIGKALPKKIDTEIEVVTSDQKISYLLAAQGQAGNYYLDKKQLNQKELNEKNIQAVIDLFSR